MNNEIAVKCNNEKEWATVVEFSKRKYKYNYPESCYPGDLHVNLKDGCYCSGEYYKSIGTRTISYQDFEKDYLNKSKEVELVENQWYEANFYDQIYTHIFKFKKLIGSQIAVYKWRYMISDKTDLGGNSDNFGSVGYCKNLKLANLETVYQYFPEERVNSNTDFVFIPGNVYVGTWDNNRVIFRPSDKCLDKPSDLINANNQFKTNQTHVCTGTNISFRDATKDEKDWLEACLKANKFVPKKSIPMKEEKFKVGDYVECIRSYDNITAGMKGKIVRIMEGSYIPIGVNWEGLKDGHNCSGNIPGSTSGYYVGKEHIKVISAPKDPENNNYIWRHFELMPVGWSPESTKSNNTMSKEELLEYARKHYPIGTKFTCLHVSGRETIPIIESNDYSYDVSCIRVYGKWGCGCIWDGKNWAKVIETPMNYGTKGQGLGNPSFADTFQYPYTNNESYYVAGKDGYRKNAIELLSLQENDDLIEPYIKKTKSIKKELVEQENVILF